MMHEQWIDKVEGLTFRHQYLLSEFQNNIIKELKSVYYAHKVLVQKKYHLVNDGIASPIIDDLPEVQTAIDKVSKLMDFNFVTYRCVEPYTAYGWHRDAGGICYHIPLTTNPGCWFVYENKSFHMPADGSLYRVVNGQWHTFVNSGGSQRIHITFERI